MSDSFTENSRRQEHINKQQQKELAQLRVQLEKAEEVIKDFADFGTRHDVNPTGQFKNCGCFDSINGDHWQGYIRSQDQSVKNIAQDYFNQKDARNEKCIDHKCEIGRDPDKKDWLFSREYFGKKDAR